MSDQGHDLFRAQERGAQDEEGVLDEAEGDYRKQGGERGQQQEAAKRRRVMAEAQKAQRRDDAVRYPTLQVFVVQVHAEG